MSTEPTPNPAGVPKDPATPHTDAPAPDAPSATGGSAGPTEPAAASAHAEAFAAADASAGPVKHHDDHIAELRRELSDLKDKNLRLLADMENLRRRTEDEKASSARYAITRFATDIVTVGDNFTRAMGAVPAGAAEADPALKSLVEGVQMTEREFLNVLERNGVKRIASKGEIFSPHLHQPMMQVPNPEVPAGTILQVFQEGYTIGDRLLRAAVVTVAEGGPKPGKPAESETPPEGNAAASIPDAPPSDTPPKM